MITTQFMGLAENVNIVFSVILQRNISQTLGFFEAGADQRDHCLIDHLALARRQPQHLTHPLLQRPTGRMRKICFLPTHDLR
jgi:hypothetical protein